MTMKLTISKNLDPQWSPIALSETQKAALSNGDFVVVATQKGYSAATLRRLNGATK